MMFKFLRESAPAPGLSLAMLFRAQITNQPQCPRAEEAHEPLQSSVRHVGRLALGEQPRVVQTQNPV